MIKNEIIKFGKYHWEILDIREKKALLIANEILELRWYHSTFESVSWEECKLREYLNSEFYDSFDENEKNKIIIVKNENINNQWFGTNGGRKTNDKIFLLSLKEVCKYFGDSSTKLVNKGKQRWSIDDENNEKRKVKFENDFHWWRLRSPGYYDKTSASVNKDGKVYVRGNGVFGSPKDGGGIRPALWLNLEN